MLSYFPDEFLPEGESAQHLQELVPQLARHDNVQICLKNSKIFSHFLTIWFSQNQTFRKRSILQNIFYFVVQEDLLPYTHSFNVENIYQYNALLNLLKYNKSTIDQLFARCRNTIFTNTIQIKEISMNIKNISTTIISIVLL